MHISHTLGFPLDKIIHFLIYLTFSFLISNTLAFNRQKHSHLKGFLYTFSIGLAMEVVQYFLPYRSFETADIFSNALGALLGTFIRISL
jgi:VanZ family protein